MDFFSRRRNTTEAHSVLHFLFWLVLFNVPVWNDRMEGAMNLRLLYWIRALSLTPPLPQFKLCTRWTWHVDTKNFLFFTRSGPFYFHFIYLINDMAELKWRRKKLSEPVGLSTPPHRNRRILNRTIYGRLEQTFGWILRTEKGM